MHGSTQDGESKKGSWLEVAAFRVDDFLRSPRLETFKEMRKAAERAKVWEEVRSAALLYLEKGKLPQASKSWPLPSTGLLETPETRKDQFPSADILIDIAIMEKRPDDVLRWYDDRASKKYGFFRWDIYRENSIAEAVADHYPDRSLTIWKNLAEKQIALTKPSAYETAAGYLRSVRKLLKKLEKEKEWKDYLAQLRQTHARKTKLIEILTRVDSRSIVKG